MKNENFTNFIETIKVILIKLSQKLATNFSSIEIENPADIYNLLF